MSNLANSNRDTTRTKLVAACVWISLVLVAPLLSAPAAAAVGGADAATAEKAVHAVLDDFHDAAAKADEVRYFGHFAPEGVFFGTDPGERWTVAEFREWASPYFQRDIAWAFTPHDRHVFLGPHQTVAWFDEIATSATYGDCRGTGALRLIDGAWKITQYNLTIPVPNDLAADLLRRIRGEAADVTQIVIVRHAEKVVEAGNNDPGLTEEGAARAERLAGMTARLGIDAVYATQFQRTQRTVAPTAAKAGVEVQIADAGDVRKLAELLREKHVGQTVVVAGHSNTVPGLLAALGIKGRIRIDDTDYGNLFVVTLCGNEAPILTALRF